MFSESEEYGKISTFSESETSVYITIFKNFSDLASSSRGKKCGGHEFPHTTSSRTQ